MEYWAVAPAHDKRRTEEPHGTPNRSVNFPRAVPFSPPLQLPCRRPLRHSPDGLAPAAVTLNPAALSLCRFSTDGSATHTPVAVLEWARNLRSQSPLLSAGTRYSDRSCWWPVDNGWESSHQVRQTFCVGNCSSIRWDVLVSPQCNKFYCMFVALLLWTICSINDELFFVILWIIWLCRNNI
jgi:hypothetical protein